MRKNSDTKKGMAAIYVVVFTTLLLGIITISFVRIMVSETSRTSKDYLSDSAYNSALAGVEDAKSLLLKYSECLKSGSGHEGCESIKETIEATKDESDDSQDCDVISAANGADNQIETTLGSSDNNAGNSQAYTCVNIQVDTDDVKKVISENNPVAVIPLRPVGDVKDVSMLKISWQIPNDTAANPVTLVGGDSTKPFESANPLFGEKGVDNDIEFVDLNAINVMVIQTRNCYGDGECLAKRTNEFYQSDTENQRANRMRIQLVPTKTGGGNTISASDMVATADKQYNAPYKAACSSTTGGTVNKCEVLITLPKLMTTGDTDRDPDAFFAVIDSVYSNPDVLVSVSMLRNADDIMRFNNVQPIIDSTGRAGDLMRRVETRVSYDNGESLIPTAELSVNGDIEKNFYVTKNCIKGTVACSNSGSN